MNALDVMSESWDYLIVLDACRYDYFASVRSGYLDGDLSCRWSAGSSTNEWRDKSFAGFYDDTVYITANPQISGSSRAYGFCAGEHFHAVHEVWRKHWVRGTVLPEAVTAAADEIITSTPGKRFIIHYMQPHAPYLTLAEDVRGYVYADTNSPRQLEGVDYSESRVKRLAYQILLGLVRWNRALGNHPDWIIRRWLKMAPKAPMEIVLCRYSVEQLREAYRQNLELVLGQAAILIDKLKGRIAVTSDHGELLGENGCFSHPTGSDHPILRQVPWLIIEKRTANPLTQRVSASTGDYSPAPTADPEQEDRDLAEKLKALGYF